MVIQNNEREFGKIFGFKYEIKNHKLLRTVVSIVMFLGVVFYILNYAFTDRTFFSQANVFSIALCLGAMVGCFVFSIILLNDRIKADESTVYFYILLVVLYLSVFSEGTSWLEEGKTNLILLNQINTFFSFFSVSLMLFICWEYFVCLEKKSKQKVFNGFIMTFLLLSHFTVLVLNLFFKFIYYIDANGYYFVGELYLLGYISPVLILFFGMGFSYKVAKNKRTKTTVLVSFLATLVSSVLSILEPDYSFGHIMPYFIMILIYGSVQVERNIEMLQKREEVANKNALLAKQSEDLMHKEQQIMVSQINPHFLFNTLTTIDYLCKTDPKLASKTVINLASYLRVNVDTLTQMETVAFKKEMQHVNYYIAIEKLRFSNIEIEFEILDDDFELPALTIQPLVENAIRHGVRGVKNGHIKVLTYFKDGAHCIVIEDNGVGFDVEKFKEDNQKHVGLENVKKRLQMTVNGTMKVESTRGVGTKITIIIPEKPIVWHYCDVSFGKIIRK